ACFGPEEIFFNTWLFHARNPWVGGWDLLGENIVKALGYAWVWLALLIWLWCDRRRAAVPAAEPLPRRAVSFVRLLLWAAVCQLPLGLLAPLKSGGTLGSLHSVEWALLAAMVALWHRWSQPAETGVAVRPARIFALAVLASLVMAGCSIIEFRGVWTPYRGLDVDLALARAQTGRIYFPWNPMLTIITERRVYPLDDALYGLATAGLEPPPEKIRAAVPAGAELIYYDNAQSRFAVRYFQPPGLDSSGPAAAPVQPSAGKP
ncbi:MAG: hypothetical protein WCL04_10715, partial [Verrucomicrobiota bacterium]